MLKELRCWDTARQESFKKWNIWFCLRGWFWISYPSTLILKYHFDFISKAVILYFSAICFLTMNLVFTFQLNLSLILSVNFEFFFYTFCISGIILIPSQTAAFWGRKIALKAKNVYGGRYHCTKTPRAWKYTWTWDRTFTSPLLNNSQQYCSFKN